MNNSIELFKRADVRKRFDELLGKRSAAFITSVLQIVNNSEMLKQAEPLTVYSAALTAAALDLPINSNLGFAFIVPYNVKKKDGTRYVAAQFQIGYKGYIQLAQRSGLFQTISATPVYEGQIVDADPLKGYVFDWSKKKSETIVGYAAYFKLINGFEKTVFMTVAETKKHAQKYSASFRDNIGLWASEFDFMACKTVLKLLLARYAPLSIEMQQAIVKDQAVISGDEVMYVDNEEVKVDKEAERLQMLLQQCTTRKQVLELQKQVQETYGEVPEHIEQELQNRIANLNN
ncbi:MAG: hypothetical protein KatS3mg031_2968 [Chitinophagales bacterium]|nr:MAG: hypothetical protein KatS3mg031_2968 [Chitinophagales bacterium]